MSAVHEPADVVFEAWNRSGACLASEFQGRIPLRLVNNCAYLILIFAQLEPRIQRHWEERYGYEAGYRTKLKSVIEDLGLPLSSQTTIMAGYEIRNDCAHGRIWAVDLDLRVYHAAIIQV